MLKDTHLSMLCVWQTLGYFPTKVCNIKIKIKKFSSKVVQFTWKIRNRLNRNENQISDWPASPTYSTSAINPTLSKMKGVHWTKVCPRPWGDILIFGWCSISTSQHEHTMITRVYLYGSSLKQALVISTLITIFKIYKLS